MKLRRHLGKTREDDAHAKSGQQYGQWAELSQESGDGGRQSKHAAADHRVHDQRGEAPAANGANELAARRARWERFRHRVVLSQIEDSQASAVSWAPDFV